MHTTTSVLWDISLAPEERFEITGSRFHGATEYEIRVHRISNPHSGGKVDLSGRARRIDGGFGMQSRIITVKPDDERLPRPVRDEIARVAGHAARLISKVQS